ncbi:MAG: NUDIX hydrolase [Candidatus Marinimicrobia bacterium]|nr:NUDIX hydrolase [Candidatus Neomarinimicrobiota bacterium]
MKYNYCYKCGHKTRGITRDGRKRDYCPNCQIVLYDNPIPSVAICTRDQKGRILLVKRAVEPEKGKWCLPGGFIERGETTQETALRELEEETALEGRSPELLGIETHLNGYFGDILLIGYTITLDNYEIRAGDDAAAAKFFNFNEMPSVVFQAHRNFIKIYKERFQDQD